MKEKNKLQVEGFALRGEEVENSENKHFEILKIPEYEDFNEQETGKTKRRLKILIKFNDCEIEYFPNKTSQKKIITKKGRFLENWVGFKGRFEVLSQKVGGETKKVIYIQ